MFASKSTLRSSTARPGWNRIKTHKHRSERIVTRAAKAVVESLERRMLLSVSASMVADINLTTASSNPFSMADLGNGKVAFFANDGFHGEEPFVTDGTAAGTMLLKDIDPGPKDSIAVIGGRISYSGYQPGAAANGKFFFSATDGVSGDELWATDGTPGGTTLVKDIDPGSAGSDPSQMVAVGNTLFFVANDGTHGSQLWKSDGTPDGTSMVTAIGGSQSGVGQLGPAFNGRLFFSANDGVHGYELWSTDGTAAGTAMVIDLNPGQASSAPTELTASGSQLFFVANDGTYGNELWVTDGTAAGTRLVADLAFASASSDLRELTDVNGTLFFEDSGNSTYDLYKTDGTAEGTVLVHSFNFIYSMIDHGGRDYFAADDGVSGAELWQSDGTSAGTTEVADLAPGSASSFPQVLTVAGPNLFFSASAGDGAQLYLIMAVGAAPTAISPVGSAAPVGYTATPAHFQAVGSGVYFTGYSSETGIELWHSDGTAAGTAMVADINTTTNGSAPIQLTEINGHGVFAANDAIHGTELWATDGSAGGTTLLKDIVPGPTSGLLGSNGLPSFAPVRLGNYLYFVAGASQAQIWRTDGTANGTTLCLSYPSAFGGILQLTSVNGSLYFFLANGTGPALYISDGTSSGTTWLHYIDPPDINGEQPNAPQFSVVGSHVIFAANGMYGLEPWVTDGTPAGTMLLEDINPGVGSSLPTDFYGLQRFVNLGPDAYFVTQYQTDTALWKTDGTLAGTSVVKDFTAINITGVDDLTVFNGRLYFSTYTGTSEDYGGDLWTSDGTPGGTVQLASYPSNRGLNPPSDYTVVNNTLFFFAVPSSDAQGQELFASDGTAAGTGLVPGADLAQTQAGSGPYQVANVQGTLYFTAPNQAGTTEVWRVDQSPSGGMSVEDVWPAGPTAIPSNPNNIVGMDGTLFFQATDQAHGAELWKLNLLQASAGGPYLATGRTVQLDASASRDPNPSYSLSYSWDLDGDGIFGETGLAAGKGNETGVNPSFYANQNLPGVYPVTVQVTGSWQNTATATSYVSVPPHAYFVGDTVTFTLGTAVTNASIQSWNIDWGDGTPVENYTGSTTSVSHLFATASGASPFMVQISPVGGSGAVEPLPIPVTIYADPVLNNGSLYLTGTSGNDLAYGSNPGTLFEVELNGAVRDYNSSLISHFVYSDGGGDDQIYLRDSFLATLNLSTGNDSISNAGATAIVNPGTGKIRVDSSFGTTTFAASNGSGLRQLQFSNLNISNRAKLVFANTNAALGDYSNHANRTLAIVDAGGLNITFGGTLDLGDNSMLLKYAPANKTATDTMVNSLLSSGYAGGAWNGSGLTSSQANYDAYFGSASRAVGWADQFDVGVNSFEGDSADVADGNEIMIKFTYYGDTDLDGEVAASDSAAFSNGVHITTGNAYWEFGDMDFSGGKPTASDSQSFSTGLNAYKTFGVL